jgi:hypothetical protein
LAQVTDTYLLVGHAEMKIVNACQNVTLKSVLSVVMKDLQLKKVDNVCIVLNDNRGYSDQYGYGYGYHNKGNTGNGRRKNKRLKT